MCWVVEQWYHYILHINVISVVNNQHYLYIHSVVTIVSNYMICDWLNNSHIQFIDNIVCIDCLGNISASKDDGQLIITIAVPAAVLLILVILVVALSIYIIIEKM